MQTVEEEDPFDKEKNSCGSISPRTSRTCNHVKGHRGKCARIVQDAKKRWFVLELWENNKTPDYDTQEKKQ
jgi:hypothetical protein